MFGHIKRGKNGLFNVMSLTYQLILVFLPCILCILYSKGVQFHCLTLPYIELCSWVHKKSGYPELGNHPLIRQVAEAGRRIPAKPSNRKKALEMSQVKKVISRLRQGDLGPGYRSCDLMGGQLFLWCPPLLTFPPTHPKILSFYTIPV